MFAAAAAHLPAVLTETAAADTHIRPVSVQRIVHHQPKLAQRRWPHPQQPGASVRPRPLPAPPGRPGPDPAAHSYLKNSELAYGQGGPALPCASRHAATPP